MNLDPYLLRAFLTAAEIGTVNGAAATLNRTQAAVSMQIRKLEDLLGKELFERSSRGLTLTADGQFLITYAREILALNEEVRRRLQATPIEGRVRLGVVEDFAATRLIHILKAFRDRNPKVNIDIIVESNRRLAAMFESDKLDVTICDVSQINRKPILVWNEELRWVARSDIAFSSDAPLPIIMFEESCPWRAPAMAALANRNLQWTIVCEASTLVAMITAVRVGIGVGPMIAATVPDDCRMLDGADAFLRSPRIDVGLYAHSGASGESYYLADFIARNSRLK
ncbi:LysR substrate-binding domain-containing protein [Labrys wisconsinensis]|uniref:DNA-binding transcriptional LysR family regulator n=1 Tax=Labrys wisconsinensis TaxID=425677 RepID=A0ABU0J6A7_9HYPH|nr:LysR substrate-binding domain-containing protein [Labrys wisconsinensis]MDQ0469170.1 DNA-binding transcriptional LysR family regulator [Labrys wisconsinensis]